MPADPKISKKVKVVRPRKPSPRVKRGKPQPWAMKPDETLGGFHYFCFYRDMQRRSIAKLAEVFGMNRRTLERTSQRFGWRDRVRAWDVELDRRVRDLQATDIADMKKRHINLGVGMQTAAVKELQALVAKIEKADREAKKKDPKGHHEPLLSVPDIIRLSQHGTQLERLSRGEPTDHVRTDTPDDSDLSMLSIKELKLLKTIKNKISSGE